MIDGAHQGKGLGHKFLAHIERCKILLHLIDSSDDKWQENYNIVKNEIKKYGKLKEKKEIIVLTKSDISKDNIKKINKNLKKISGKEIIIISSFSEEGLEGLIQILFDNCDVNNV